MIRSQKHFGVVIIMNPAKRRRVDDSASTLRKSFRSPLKAPNKDLNSSIPNIANDLDQQKPNLPPSSLSNQHTTTEHSSRSSPLRESILPDHPGTVINEVTVLQKKYSALAQRLKKLRQDLDVVKQARNINSGNQTDQIDQLISKWRNVARSAAEEMFEITNNRVKEMGGLRAWQKQAEETSRHEPDIRAALRDAHQDHESCDEEYKHHDKAKQYDLEEAEDAHDKQVSLLSHATDISVPDV